MFIDFSTCSLLFKDVCGFSRILVDVLRFLSIFMDVNGCLWICMDFIWFQKGLKGRGFAGLCHRITSDAGGVVAPIIKNIG